jgi:hypothetical protein
MLLLPLRESVIGMYVCILACYPAVILYFYTIIHVKVTVCLIRFQAKFYFGIEMSELLEENIIYMHLLTRVGFGLIGYVLNTLYILLSI